MIKTVTILFILTLIIQLGYSQNTYPQKLVYNNDTIVAIKPNQVTEINLTFNELNRCNEKLNNYQRQIESYSIIVSEKDTLIKKLRIVADASDMQYKISQDIVRRQSDMIDSQSKKIGLLKKVNQALAGVSAVLLIITLIK